MSKLLFVGDSLSARPWRMLGLDVVVPAADPADHGWVAQAAAEGYSLVLVDEPVLREREEAVALLARKLRPTAAVTVVPDAAAGPSEHLRFLRQATVRAIGVDTWQHKDDAGPGANP